MSVDEVGKDVVRFIMLTRKNDAQLDFDLAKVFEQSKDNPVFYVQYAHAGRVRCCATPRQMFPSANFSPASLAAGPLDRLTDPAEIALIRQLAGWPRLVEGAAEAEEPHRIAFYLYDLAAAFHGLWTMGKDDADLALPDGKRPTSVTGPRRAGSGCGARRCVGARRIRRRAGRGDALDGQAASRFGRT